MHRHPSHLYLPLLLFEHSDTAQVYLLISDHCTQVEHYIPTDFLVFNLSLVYIQYHEIPLLLPSHTFANNLLHFQIFHCH